MASRSLLNEGPKIRETKTEKMKTENMSSIISRCSLFLVSAIVTTALASASEAGFAGHWKLNMEKSQLTGQTYSLEKNAAGGLHFDMQGFAYDFDMDGKEHSVPDGTTVVARAMDPSTCEYTFSMKGKVVGTMRATVQGDTTTMVAHMIKADGSGVDQTYTFARVSGGPGPLGKWKTTEVKGAPNTLVIETKGKNGIKVAYPESQAECAAKFDGKDHALRQAGHASKMTLAFEKTAENTVKITTKVQGKPLYTDILTLSADGNTLTDDGSAVAVNEPVKSVYDRE